ncbi:MAG TPA: hypothetical protein VD968_01445 [Pyrinomonadaceae bacterium]|nr:hypothetical protein [Pyrinomonadaceae bacterium]
MSHPTQGRGGRKSRIVIDVTKAQAEAQARRARGRGRGRRILSVAALVVLGVVLLAFAGGYFWWQSYKKGPAYSLALMVDAARRDDMQAVESLIDSDTIAQGFIPQVIERLTGPNAPPLTPQARASVATALPQLIPRVRETAREEVAAMAKSAAGPLRTGANLPFPLFAVALSRAVNIKEEGDTAVVTIPGVDASSEMTMRRDGERWKVINVRDEQLAAGIAARLAPSLPAQQQQQQQQQGQPRRRGGR